MRFVRPWFFRLFYSVVVLHMRISVVFRRELGDLSRLCTYPVCVLFVKAGCVFFRHADVFYFSGMFRRPTPVREAGIVCRTLELQAHPASGHLASILFCVALHLY